MDEKTKQVLLKMVRDLEDLRAIVGLLLADSPRQSSVAEVAAAKSVAKKTNQEMYDELRKEVESL